ncbi:Hint domain-containing protein [Profundibacterium mesophilum]|uniref:Glycerophosphoryl diester phosphodiesterase n=1 Tax=Profundibacterium mesophilum KAUST100406-0324 TaxID=1037889 RepID=A0A921NX48_9RHOB|nr:Hint domain-containing protein [Profundibacterium mesophilum]KAF0675143.1 glycerophosphoryl diester phosphodiesterase [Profundibacterium mesophilum KAUST100406-0324]
MSYLIDWSNMSADGTSAVPGPGGEDVNVTVSTPQNSEGQEFRITSRPEWGGEALRADGGMSDITAAMSFDRPVSNISFELYDVDGHPCFDDRVSVVARNADGELVMPVFTSAGGHRIEGNSVESDRDAAEDGLSGAGEAGSVGVTIPGEIVSLEIVFAHGDSADRSGIIGISDMRFDDGGDGAAATAGDGIVEGSAGDDLIDLAYRGDPEGDRIDAGDAIFGRAGSDDDIVEAGAGNDTVAAGAGNDLLRGGAGDDLLRGEAGDDTIRGDAGESGSPATPAARESFEWDRAPDPDDGGAIDNGDAISGFSQDTGNATVTFSVLQSSGPAGASFQGSPQNVDGIDGGGEEVDALSSLSLTNSAPGARGVYALDFSTEARNVAFRINDIDNDGAAVVRAFDPSGAPIEVTLTGGAGVALTDEDGVSGAETARSLGGNEPDASPRHSVLVEIAGPVGRIEIEHEQFGEADSGINVTDVYFDAAPAAAAGGSDDTLIGGAGDDVLYGEDGRDSLSGDDGDDTLDGGAGDDTLVGGAGADRLTGGAGNDLLRGGDDADRFDGLNAGDTVLGGSGATPGTGVDYDQLDLSGSFGEGGFRLDNLRGDSDGNGFDGEVVYLGADGAETGRLTFENIENIIPCFTPGSLIATASGERLVEDLREGDRIITRDNGFQEIRWVGARRLGFRDLTRQPHLRPVLIRQGALGNGMPMRDMMVSPNHRVLVANDQTALYFEEREVLVAAKHLVNGSSITSVEALGACYIHFMFDHHEVVLSDGSWTESFQPGDYTLKGLGDAQRREIFALFPDLAETPALEGYRSARRTLKRHEAELLAR